MDLYEIIITAVASVEFGVIAFFLKDYFAESKKKNEAIKSCATQKELDDYKTDTKEKINKITDDISSIKDNYISKDDFYRYADATDRKLNTIIDILMKRDGKNGQRDT